MPSGERLPGIEPFGGDRIRTGEQRHDPSDDRAGRVPVAQPADGPPEGFLIIAEPMTCTPQGERHRVLRRDARAVAQDGDRTIDRGTRIQVAGSSNPLGDEALGDMRQDEVQERVDSRKESRRDRLIPL
jgi:hypothetical protein